MGRYGSRENKRTTRLWIVVVALTVITLAGGMWFMSPPPPKKIRLGTGAADGAYYSFGQEYARRLNPMGLQVDVVQTNGSIDNWERLLRREIDVAFVQGGTYPLVKEKDTQGVLRGLAAVYLEPLWVFSRNKEHVSSLADLKGHKICVGAHESGTEAVSRSLLEAHGITPENSTLVNLSSAEAAAQLKAAEGDLAAGLFVASYKAPAITGLLHKEDVQLLSFRRDVAYCRQFPYLTPVKLAEGVLDLQYNIPAEEKTLLAPAAMLVCREDLHPQVVNEVLRVAKAIHEKGDLLDPSGRFPTLEGVDLPIHDEAETYMRSGESFLSRVLPYWALRWVSRLKLLLLPLLAVWVPFLKVLPMIYSWRVNRLLHRHYAALRELESSVAQTNQPDELRARLDALERLRTDMEALSRKVPARLQRDLYHWRLHVALVKTEALDRLHRIEQGMPPGQVIPGEVHTGVGTGTPETAVQAAGS